MPRRVVQPFPEVGLAALGQVFPPCRVERSARSFEAGRGAVPFIAGIASGIKSANPLPAIRRPRSARAFDDHADAHAGEMDVLGFRAIVDAFAGKGAHAPLKRGGEAIGKPLGIAD